MNDFQDFVVTDFVVIVMKMSEKKDFLMENFCQVDMEEDCNNKVFFWSM